MSTTTTTTTAAMQVNWSFFVGAKFYCPHALADGNQRIRTREKTLEFSSAVLSTLSRYVITTINSSSNNNLRVTWYHIRVLLR